jgi:predicted nucleotidyltransferase/DNA-binding XRE family transcriptional regulator
MQPADLIRQARRDAQLTQGDLAARAGTSQSAIARYESGLTVPSLSTLERLLRACGRSLSLDALDRPDPVPSSVRATTGPRGRLLRQKRRALLDLLRHEGATDVRVVGSVARGEDTATSDIDFLVELAPDATLVDLARVRREVSDVLGVPVDVMTSDLLKPTARARAEREAISL